MQAYMHTHTHARTHACTHAHTHARTHAHTHTHAATTQATLQILTLYMYYELLLKPTVILLVLHSSPSTLQLQPHISIFML